MQKPLHRRRAPGSGSVLPQDQPPNGLDRHGKRSIRRIEGSMASFLHPNKSNGPLLVFRIIVIAIIILCLAWGVLIIKIASNIEDPQPMGSLARPYFDAPSGRSRIGWMIRQKINHVSLKLKPVPLLDVAHMDSPVLIITFNRADYLERMLWKVFQHHPAQASRAPHGDLRGTSSEEGRKGKPRRLAGAPIIISQDGKNDEVTAVVDTYRDLFEMKLGVPLYRIEHPRETVKKVETTSFYEDTDWTPYKLLALHYGWALEQTFSGDAYSTDEKHDRKIPTPPLPKRVIILEEDIEIANDFFSLMNSTADLLDSDETLLAVSAFNDNGKEQFVTDTKRLVRSDFFPGLGWMMSRNVWEGPDLHPSSGLKVDWAPGGFWDDWMRENAQRWGRQVIRPEVSRTFHFGNIHGASEGENNYHLNEIELQDNDVHWEDEDLSYLDPSVFAENYWNRASRARLVETVTEARSFVAHSDVRLSYSNFEVFRKLASSFGVMDDEKAGVPRTGYEGIVEIRYGQSNFFVFLTPPYVGLLQRPLHFGTKTWKNYSKEELMQELNIENVVFDDRPDLDWSLGNWDY